MYYDVDVFVCWSVHMLGCVCLGCVWWGVHPESTQWFSIQAIVMHFLQLDS